MTVMRRARLPLDLDAGFLVGVFGVVYAAAVGVARGLMPGVLSGRALAVLAAAFGVAGFVVGSVIAGRPDFGPTKRTALARGFVAVIPLYAAGGLLFLPVRSWFSLLPAMSVAASALVGPPIGVFMYRLHRRRDAAEPPDDPAVELAWLKGELLGSWTPLLLSIAVLAALGVGMRALPEEVTAPPRHPPAVPTLVELLGRLPALEGAVAADSSDAAARCALGRALTSFGRFRAAVDLLTASVELEPQRIDCWRALGRATFYAGQMQYTARAYWNVLRLDPAAVGSSGLDRVMLDAALKHESGGGSDDGDG